MMKPLSKPITGSLLSYFILTRISWLMQKQPLS
ncbi:hypothetical protein LINPERHAP1_LOCUS38225 [Linum perenne]